MAQPQLTPEQLKALQALKAQGIGDEQALAMISGQAPGVLSQGVFKNPFGLASQPIDPGILSTQPVPEHQPMAPPPPQQPMSPMDQIRAANPNAGRQAAGISLRGAGDIASVLGGGILSAGRAVGNAFMDVSKRVAAGVPAGAPGGASVMSEAPQAQVDPQVEAIRARAAELQATGMPPAPAMEQARAEILGGAPAPAATPGAPAVTPLAAAIAESPRTAPPAQPEAPVGAGAPAAAPQGATATPMQEAISGSRLTADPTQNPTAFVYQRGAPSSLYESGGRYDAINQNDTGGVSYGRNQIHSNNMPEFTSKYAPGVFDGLTPGTEAFNQRWKEWATTAAGKDAQHRYIDDTHFVPFNDKLKSTLGLDTTTRSPAIEELAYSTSVQFGPGNTVFEKALAGRDVATMSDAEILDAVTKYKIDNVDTLFQSTPTSKRPGLVKRFHNERETLGQYLDAPRPEGGPPLGGQGGGSPMGGTAPGGEGILSQGGPTGQSGPFGPPQAQEGILSQGYPKSRADEFMERIYSSPWKGALYNALAAIADVNPYAHVEMLRQMDADDREEFKMYQDLQAPMDPLKQAQIAKIEYEMQGGGGKEIKTQTWDPEAGGYRVLYADSSAGFVPATGAEYRPPSQVEADKTATAAQKEAALLGAEFDKNLEFLDSIMAEADEKGLYGVWPNNPVVTTFDKWVGDPALGDQGSKERNQWRKKVQLAASTDAVTRLAQIGGSDTEREFQWMLEMSPKIMDNKAAFLAYREMMQIARDKIRVREAGGLDEATRKQFDDKRDELIKRSKMDSYLE